MIRTYYVIVSLAWYVSYVEDTWNGSRYTGPGLKPSDAQLGDVAWLRLAEVAGLRGASPPAVLHIAGMSLSAMSPLSPSAAQLWPIWLTMSLEPTGTTDPE